MTYVTEAESFGRKEYKIDMPRFAADLTKALTALLKPTIVKLLPATEYVNERQTIQVGTEHINLTADNWKRRVSVSISAPDVPWDDRSMYDKAHKTESARLNPEARDIEAIARDINRRVIEPAKEPLRLQREHAKRQADNRSSIVRLANALKARLPILDVRTDEKAQRATLYGNSDGHYLSATLHADATVAIERIGSMSLSKFERIVAILNEKGVA